jgi:ferredoxin
MAHVVTGACEGCRFTDCVVVCPMECFVADERMLYIDPDDCIDCGACIPECPVEAIYWDANTPEPLRHFIPLNAERVMALKPGGRITEPQPPLARPGCG